MTVAGPALGTRPARRALPRWAVALLGLALAVAGLVALAFAFAGPRTYGDIARASGFERVPFLVPVGAPVERRRAVEYDVPTRVSLHEEALDYVLGSAPGTPRDPSTRDPLFTPDEGRHLADVRGVLAGARDAGIAAAAIAAAIVVAAGLRGAATLLRAIRGAALLAAVVVAAVGAVAAVAFEPAFLVFHQVFFPQGNFLFDPVTSNLLALYPEQYWYGVTIRIGATFAVCAAVVAGLAALGLRSRRIA